jgi:hypothetical protein
MAAVLKPGSSQIIPGAFPKALRPTVTGGKAHFECSEITATGSVTLTGSHPDAAGWALGFIQVEWIDTNWLYYRGRQNNHGSIFFQRSRPPTRPSKVCRDVKAETDIYYEFGGKPPTVTAADTFPKTLTVHHFDQPGEHPPAVVQNSLTGEDNFIREAQLEFLFCTVLSAREPGPPPGKFHHLKSFYWNVRWQARFLPHDFATPLGAWFVTPIAEGQGSARSHVIEGEPTDKRFKDILTDLSVRGCDAIIPLYAPDPDGVVQVGKPGRRESKVWETFNLNI